MNLRALNSQSRIKMFMLLLIVTLCPSRSYAGYVYGPGISVAQVHCGTERWPAKTLSDGVAIDFNHPIVTTVSNLAGLTPPSASKGMNATRTPEETHVYTIHAILQKYKLENNDKDFHIVISDFGGSSNNTMIAEIPNSQCQGVSGDGWTAEFDSMRSAIETKFGVATPSMRVLNTEVTITGPLFFDFPHGQTGHAPNFAELHPVLALKFGSASPPSASPLPNNPEPSGSPAAASPSASAPTSIAKFRTTAAAQKVCPSDTVVWLNTRTGFYHRKGHPYYGTTTRGAYVCEQEAIQNGYQEGF